MEETTNLLKPGQRIKPYLKTDEVRQILRKNYNIEVDSYKELASYDDRNFFITINANTKVPCVEDTCPEGYVFKILNSLDSKFFELVDAQNQMMLYLNKHGIPCPRPVQNIYGTLMSNEELEEKGDEVSSNSIKSKHVARLLTFIPGEVLRSIPYTKELFYQIGEMAAKIDLLLLGFHHECLIKVDRIWNLSAVPKLRQFLFAVRDEENRLLVLKIIEEFEKVVVPSYPKLSSGPIHGDLNEQNILVKRDENVDGGYVLSGVIDFGDIHHSYHIFELAITICYMMIDCTTMDILEAPGHVLAGYNIKRLIPDEEFAILKECIAGRLCQSLVLGAYSYSLHPDPYVLSTAKNGWNCLKKLWNTPKDDLYKKWRGIMESYSG